MADNQSSEGKMHVADEMRTAVTTLAGERRWHDTRESWLAGAARKAGISYRQAKAFFYGEARNPSVETVERVRAALKHKLPGAAVDDKRIEELRALVSELHRAADRLESLGLGASADQARAQADRLGNVADREG